MHNFALLFLGEEEDETERERTGLIDRRLDKKKKNAQGRLFGKKKMMQQREMMIVMNRSD